MMPPRFKIDISNSARRTLAQAHQHVEQCLAWHQRGDWGDVDTTDKVRNDHAAIHDLDVTSYDRQASGMIPTITTEFDRAFTRVKLLSED